MASDPALQLRPVTLDELPALFRMVSTVFLDDSHDDELEHETQVFEAERSIAVFDGGEPVGAAAAYSRDMTVPGGPLPVAAVTGVAVAQTHRRRGLLTRMMRHQLVELHEQSREPVAVLWASEGAIYGRFGYGLASRHGRLRAETGQLALRRDVDRGGRALRECSADDALPLMRSVYEAVRLARVGHLDRRDRWWHYRLFDPARSRDGATALRFLVHSDEHGNPDGYAIFNVKGTWSASGPRGAVSVREMAAATPAAYAAVWGFLIDMDLTSEVRWNRCALDEPLFHLVDNPGLLQSEASHGLWVRLVDVDRALSARRYSAPIDVVLDVSDSFCPWNAGRYRLTGDPAAASYGRSDDPPDLTLSSTELGAAYLGGTTLATMAAAGLVTEHRAGAVEAASIAFSAAREPSCPEDF